jgi:dipeptidyl aminopeptidase/acylaminoacyl peptidase
MKKLIFILPAFLLFACSNEEESREVASYSIEDLYDNTSVSGGYFSPDGSKLLVSSNETGIYNAYEYSADGNSKKQLTRSTDESIFAITYFPEDERFLYHSDKGGDENDHIYLVTENDSVVDLTPYEGSKSHFAGWADDDKSFYFMSNKRDPKFFDLYEMDIESFTPRLFYQNDSGYEGFTVSPDEKFLATRKSITTNNDEMYLINRKTGEIKHLSPHEGDATYNPQFFNNDNNALFYLTNEGTEFSRLVKYDLENENQETVYETDWDVWYAYNSDNEKYRVIGVNEDAKTAIHVFDLETGEEIDFPELEGGSITSVHFSDNEEKIRLRVGSSALPSEIYVYDFKTGDLVKITDNLNPKINEEDMVLGEVVRYPSFDDLMIPAILYKPHQASKNHPVPGLIWVHGGPGGQSRLSYFPLIQYLVNKGYAVLAVNNRGSSGYGKNFYKMDDKKHGDVDLKDCIEGKEYLAGKQWVDGDKIGIIGGSYGGYMVMAALTFTPEEFDVGVNIFGVTNWLRTLKSIPPWWESFREALYNEMGDPTTADSVALYNKSPLFFANQITKPLMVLQGANDPRVLQVESDEIVEAARENGIPVEYVLFEDEGHGFVKKENQIEGYGKIGEFLDQYLKGIPKEENEEEIVSES